MSKKNYIRNLVLTSSVLLTSVSVGFGQKAETTPTPINPEDKPRNVKVEVKEVYKNWIKKDVAYIITSEEKRAFNQLKTDDERENFIENFWRRRDPNPDTEENEFREEYYERIA